MRRRTVVPTALAAALHLAWASGAAAAPSSPAAPLPEVLTLSEAAELLRVDAAVVRKLAEAGGLPGRQVGDEWRFSRSLLFDWLAGGADRPLKDSDTPLAARRPATPSSGHASLSPTEMAAVVGRGVAPAADAQDRPAEPIGKAPTEKSASEVFLRDQLILLGPKELTLDIGAFYARNDDLVLTGSGPATALATVESDAFGSLAVARYSLDRHLELFATASYRDQEVSIFQGGRRISTASRSDFGDIGLGLRRTLQDEGPGRPDLILTLEGAIPTGSSSYALGGGLTFVKSFDPAVLYGSVDYRHAFSRNFTDATWLQPKDRLDATIGYALALNDTLTLNTSLTGTFTGRSTFDAAVLRQTETFNLLFGLTTRVSRALYLQPSVSFRLNGPGNGVVFGLNIPYAFGR